MDVLALLVALVALALSTAAYRRTGGLATLQHQAGEARHRAANALGRAEVMVRPHPDESETTSSRDERAGE